MKKIYLSISIYFLIVINVLAQSPCQISLTSAAGTDAQTICAWTSITDITYSISGTSASVAGLPSDISGALSGGVYRISGTPHVANTYNYTITVTGGCSPDSSITGSIISVAQDNIKLTSAIETDSQSICINTALIPIHYTIMGGQAIFSGLPAGVTGSMITFNNLTIDGTPNVAGIFQYTITANGVCMSQDIVTGTITSGMGLATAGTDKQNVCKNNPITPISYNIIGGDIPGPTVMGLPPGVSASITSPGVFTISGTPTVEDIYTYTVIATGSCSAQSRLSGTITVGGGLDATGGSNTQDVCINSPVVPIKYNIIGGSSYVSGLPSGVTGSITTNGSPGVFTMSGTPTVEGTYSYTLVTSGTCGNQSVFTGTITVGGGLDKTGGSNIQTICKNTSIVPIKYKIIGGSATVTGLPNGVAGSMTTPTVFTISGTPNASGIFNYTVVTAGTCLTQSRFTGTIISDDATVSLSSGSATDNQTICSGDAITNISYLVGGSGTGATTSTLPPDLTASFSAGVLTISGTPLLPNGTYSYTVSATGGNCPQTSQVFTITLATACPPVKNDLRISVSSTDASDNVYCDGSAFITVNGGRSPYTVTFAGDTVIGSVYEIDGLCDGFYTVKTTDSNLDTASFTFVVGSPSTTYNNFNLTFVDSTIADILITSGISNCDIDFDNIDSITITDVNFIGFDSLDVTWTIFKVGANKTQHAKYEFSVPGTYTLILDLFCTNRLSGSVKGIDQLYINKSVTGMEMYGTSILSIYPNPNNGSFTILGIKGGVYSIINELGETIQQFNFNNSNQNTVTIDNLNNGVYFIVGFINNQISHEKIVVIK